MSLVLLVVLALENLGGNPYGLSLGLFVLPVGLALVALVVAVQARRRLDIVVSALVVVAIPLWFLALIFMFQFVHLNNSSFSP